MKKIFLLITTILLLTQCDDGNFDEPSFVFENNISECGELIIFNIGANDSEALILNLDYHGINGNINPVNLQFYSTVMTDKEYDLTNNISYRVFDGGIGNNYFCQNIPPTNPNIVGEWNGNGTLLVNNIIVLDDNDGVEELNHDLNSDDDDIPNYIDIDDDNDGILTADEINDDGSINDTDGDQIPNYLDADDDGDNIPTLNEYTTDSNGDTIDDYLDSNTAIDQGPRNQITNKYNLNYTTSFIIENMSLTNGEGNAINYSNFNYGVKTGSFIIE